MRRMVSDRRCERALAGRIDWARPAVEGAGSSAASLDSDQAMNLTHPDGRASGTAGESEASPNDGVCAVACAGAGARSARNSVSRQAGNGAVNGESVRMTSQAALTFPNIGDFRRSRKMSAN